MNLNQESREAMDFISAIGVAINANNGQCPVIEDVLTRALDLELEIRKLKGLIAGVIGRCEATGYVGMDGQYLKQLRTAIES